MSVHCVMTKKHINVIYFELCKKKKLPLFFKLKKKKLHESKNLCFLKDSYRATHILVPPMI